MKTTKTMLLFGVSTLLLALSSCNKEATSPSADAEGDLITFGVVDMDVNVVTRAVTETTTSTLTTNGAKFKVAGVTSGNALYFNTDATYSSASSKYTIGNYFWPQAGTTLNFYAVHPNSQAISVNASGVATLSYTQNGNTDLVVAKATAQSKPASGGNVALTFDHALSLMTLNAKPKVTSGVFYKVTSASVSAPKSGTYAYASGTWTPATNADVTLVSTQTSISSSGTAMGGKTSYIPGTVTLKFTYDVYVGASEATAVKTATYTKTKDVTLTMGKRHTVNATLPFDDSEAITLTVSVNNWQDADPIAVDM